MLTRRAFLKSMLAGGAIATGGAATSFTTFDLEKVELTVPIRSLPGDLESYRIGFLTDIHLGRSLPSEMVADAVRILNDARPDAVLLGGDYIWFADSPLGKLFAIPRNDELQRVPDDELASAIFSLLGKLLSGLRAPDGIFAVLGNHDRWTEPETCVRALSAHGIEFLTNVTTTIVRGASKLKIAGTDDYWTGAPNVNLPQSRGHDETRLVLTHNPDYLSYLMDERDLDFDLGIAGHTHGGQIKLPVVGALKYNVLDRRLAEGHLFDEGRHLYTSRGLGAIEIPYRINCRPEVTIFTLVRA